MYEVILQPSGHCFQVPEGKTLLEAGLEAGFALPYSCRSAVCSTCRCRIRSGTVDHGIVFATLSKSDMADGYALMCRATPLSNLVVEVNEARGLEGIRPRTLPCRVVSVVKASAEVAILRVRVPNAEGLRFLAGQYVDFLTAGGRRHSFSIATKPAREHVTEFEFHVRRVPGGAFTGSVFDTLKARDILRMEAPLGTFYLREDSSKPIVMVAGGTGFAPIKAMCEAALEAGLFDRRSASLYWGGRTRADLYMLETALGWTHPNLRFVPVLSEATPACRWSGRTGFVHRAVMADFPDLSGHQVYACGAPIMVESARTDFVSHCRLAVTEFFADSFLTGRIGSHRAAPRTSCTDLTNEDRHMGLTREMIGDAIVEPKERNSVVKPYLMSHGTLECYNLNETRRFYEEFLGLETVRHAPIGMAVRLGLKFHVICLQVGDTLRPVSLGNHWGVDVESREKVDEAHQNALKYRDQYNIREISFPTQQHGAYSFYLADLDHNWWEIQYIPDFLHDDLFEFGDLFDSAGQPNNR